ncbi:putative YkwD family protein [Psychrobacillus insolitus]|uniref:Putative YkwD family protein n=1 Tax=Psychrobacillus insolitus TaxID=1461 RepID=A0A2W7MR16_9BACI|nr:putative YkwD family protein [Psychrobacillus insolitus]
MNKKYSIMAGILATSLLFSTNTADASMTTGDSNITSQVKTSTTYKWVSLNNLTEKYNWRFETNLTGLEEAKKLAEKIIAEKKSQVVNTPTKQEPEVKAPVIPEKAPVVETPVIPEKAPVVETPAPTKTPVEEKEVPVVPVKEVPEVVAPAPVETEKAPVVNEQVTEEKEEVQVSSEMQAVVNLTNNERAKAGLKALQIDTKLTQSAQAKSQDMKDKNYFSHTSPTYGSPFDQMKSFGVSYKSAAENIAMGQRTAAEVVDGWMNSAGHKANIMNASYTHIGVGLSDSGYYWTQQFISK